jgi:hypothetical protein
MREQFVVSPVGAAHMKGEAGAFESHPGHHLFLRGCAVMLCATRLGRLVNAPRDSSKADVAARLILDAVFDEIFAYV